MDNGVLLPTLGHKEQYSTNMRSFFEIVPCDSEMNGRLTTSSFNGVQSADPRLAQTNGKIRGTIFPFVSLTIRSKR